MTATERVTCDWCGLEVGDMEPGWVEYRAGVAFDVTAHGEAPPPGRLDFHPQCLARMMGGDARAGRARA